MNAGLRIWTGIVALAALASAAAGGCSVDRSGIDLIDDEQDGGMDAGRDARPIDAPMDSGPIDAPMDSGSIDAPMDGGPADAGVPDGGDAGTGPLRRPALGKEFSCEVRAATGIWCWGLNDTYQLGLDDTMPRTEPAMQASTGWLRMAAGASHGCAITSGDRALHCWGAGGAGRLGDEATDPNPTPTRIVSSFGGGWARIGAGTAHTCAVRRDGTLWCWGNNDQGRLGIGGTAAKLTPRQVTMPAETGWTDVSGGSEHTCAVREDGAVWCWGKNGGEGRLGTGDTGGEEHTPVRVAPSGSSCPTRAKEASWQRVSLGLKHACAIGTDGTLWCWGKDGGEERLGNDDDGDEECPVRIDSRTWTKLDAGDKHTCAIQEDGTLWCWGQNDVGQLGLGGGPDPAQIPRRIDHPDDGTWIDVSAGGSHTCAVDTFDDLYCWGNNGSGQVGVGRDVDVIDAPAPVSG